MDERSTAKQPHPGRGRRAAEIAALIVMCAAISGYYIGINSPMNPPRLAHAPIGQAAESGPAHADLAAAIPATSYAQMSMIDHGANRDWKTRLSMLKQEPYDPLAEIELDPAQKPEALEARARLRAFNGAPPTVPHPIENTAMAACLACHGAGAKSATLRIAKMPHANYINCVQCHVEQQAAHPASATAAEDFRGNSFVGLAAPLAGPRAYQEAPPVVPHSTWMRDDCLSCHGRTANRGMETTHPWRQNCLQCHAPSAELNQSPIPAGPALLPPLAIEDSHDG